MRTTMKGPAGLVPVDERDIKAYRNRGYEVVGEHAPEEDARADCAKAQPPESKSEPAPSKASRPVRSRKPARSKPDERDEDE